MDQSIEQAEQVSAQSSTISDALASIHSRVSTISQLGTQVATAAEQQRATTDEMNQNIQRISAVADETARQSQEAGASIEQLSVLTHNLKQETDRFKTS